jgi:hypothetical protein
MALTAVMVVVWAGMASGTNGDPILAGQNTTATAQTALSATQGSGVGLQVTVDGATTGAALKGQNDARGAGISGFATDPNAFGNLSQNTASTHGSGAAGYFQGNQNTGVKATTTNASSFGVSGTNGSSGTGVYGQSGGGNGVFGKTAAGTASGVYGENNGGGFGVAGRSTQPGGTGVFGEALGGGTAHAVAALANGVGGAIIASNNGGGPALELHSSGAPMTLDSAVKVDNLNADLVDGHDAADFLPVGGKAADADKLDGFDSTQVVVGCPGVGSCTPGHGGLLIANRITGACCGQHILMIPGMGNLQVDSCDNLKAQLVFDTGVTGNVDFMYSGVDSLGARSGASITSLIKIPEAGMVRTGTYTINVARNVATSTKIATIWVSWFGPGCRFEAQAILSPQP